MMRLLSVDVGLPRDVRCFRAMCVGVTALCACSAACVPASDGAPGRPAPRSVQEDASLNLAMLLVTTSMVRVSSSVGLNSITSVPA
jgi:hypothetical protein